MQLIISKQFCPEGNNQLEIAVQKFKADNSLQDIRKGRILVQCNIITLQETYSWKLDFYNK